MLISKIKVLVQFQLVTITSAPSLKRRNRGSRLIKKASFTAVLTLRSAQPSSRGFGWSVVKTGYESRKKTRIKLDVIMSEVGSIATTWICTKSFWFLRPTDELLSFRSYGRVSPGVQPGGRRLAVSGASEPISVDEGILTSVSRITI